jgi:DNA-binding transcriptional ArsR family regulator
MMPADDNESMGTADGLLPPEPLLDLDKYLAMLTVLGERPKFEIVAMLVDHDQLSEDELVNLLSVSQEAVRAGLSELVDAGLVEKRARNEPENEELSIYYRSTIFAETLFEQGICTLIDREKAMQDAYDSSA